ncbi:MAG: serine/threonine protein kinase, partial [Myxococcaceae bacterium]
MGEVLPESAHFLPLTRAKGNRPRAGDGFRAPSARRPRVRPGTPPSGPTFQPPCYRARAMNEPTSASDPRIGSVLQGRYRILERLAAGGMGIVYRGERLEVGKSVAIKFLHAWAAREEDFRKRFQVEARAMSRLTHPCCVSVMDFGVDQESPYMVMDFVTGDTLRGLLREGPLPLPRALGALRQVLAGLAHAHEQGIIHRDIKPENIIVTHAVGLGEQVRILDFGLAKLRDEVTGITSGMMLGTPAYMAPEQIHGEPVGPPTDLYAAGVLLFELLTGRKPFSATGNAELLRMHREVTPPLLRTVAPEAGFRAELEAALAKAMAKSPAERFQSATEFLAALDGAGPGPAMTYEVPPAGDAPTLPLPTAHTPARPSQEALATRNGRARPRVTPTDLPAEARDAAPTLVASAEAVASREPQATAEAPAPSVDVPSPVSRGRSRRTMLGGAAALALVGA